MGIFSKGGFFDKTLHKATKKGGFLEKAGKGALKAGKGFGKFAGKQLNRIETDVEGIGKQWGDTTSGLVGNIGSALSNPIIWIAVGGVALVILIKT